MRDSSSFPTESNGAPAPTALAESLQTDAHFRLLVESVQDYAIFLLDPNGNVATWNNGARRIKGYDAHEIVGRHFSVFYPLEDIASGKPQQELDTAARTGRVEDEGWRIRRDATRFWANVVITALRDKQGRLVGYAKVTRDMTDRLRLTELQHARELSAHVQAALENERASIARELHDDLGQQLAALKMQLARLAPDSDALARQKPPLQAQIDAIIASIRRIAAGLRPPVLDELGLFAAIEWLANDVRRRFGLVIHLDIEGQEADFQISASTSIFRIVQEALTNSVRHANASEVRIGIVCDELRFALSIEDDGRGALLDSPRAADAFGLLGMGERVRQLGGIVSFRSAPGDGFRIDVVIPLAGIVESAPR
ncbi:PAS/PAC sensor signal transduction histidine kinase [Caballeronia hypogeia]|uniref:histidine kinase n=1 Tax=Caballeronia hypogeia TaxID=1777140 RepID=A0A158D9U0_9BURK|nr:PAS domain-containing sensor histidine kinase [Caballeronia hypogeia]SAK91444.1 PAS/PAC sensor signal transduction histidine kinase [Caballeronia hypogeia]